MRRVGLATLLVLAAAPAHADVKYLVIAASSAEPAVIVERARELATLAPEGFVAQMADCGERNKMLAFVAATVASPEGAQAVAEKLRSAVPDAYVKRCAVQPGSMLALGIPVVDRSIADVPKNSMNWDDSDRLSTAIALASNLTLVIKRSYSATRDDPLEGRRERAMLATADGKLQPLDGNCYGLAHASLKDGLVAFECQREQAGDHILHSVLVYGIDGTQRTEIRHCRDPRWTGPARLSCERETVGADGKLSLAPVVTDLRT